ncbi:MAG TPA: helix-turn-helix domain-containing protein, partial [Anaeromyxobacter sp.]|nr:helix-turn-helix domain-containing protein [Anaeromyxobacter sp.]
MADLDPELLDRAVRWCAEAGRHVGAAEVRRALARLGWDELLAVRALLADPPPARPLGPHALADLARGAPPDVAAEREREGRYRSEAEADDADPAATVAPAAAAPARGRRRGRGPGVLIRRARDRASSPSVAPPPLPDVDELRRPEGRAVLERLMRHHGARRAPIVAALAAGWSGGSDGRPGDAELSALLDHHGLARAFERRERDEVLHALRAAGGVRSAAAERLGLDPDGLAPVLARLRATEQAERIREDRRSELRGRATLAERVRLLLSDEARLRDLDVLEEFEADLRARLPEHLRALRAGAEPLAVSLARSLALSRADAQALAARFALDLGPASAPSARAAHGRKGPRSPAPGARAGGARLGAGTRRGAAPPAG